MNIQCFHFNQINGDYLCNLLKLFERSIKLSMLTIDVRFREQQFDRFRNRIIEILPFQIKF